MKKALTSILVLFATLCGVLGFFATGVSRAAASSSVLVGTIKSATGQKLEGVTVSARGEGQTITTSVFTDDQGNYYFPKMQKGKYRVWAQAIGYEAGRVEVEVGATSQRKDFVMKDTKDFTNQLTGGQYVAALPLDTPQHRRMRDVFVHDCTTCHTAAFALQNRFDENGWESVITLMSHISAVGTFSPSSAPPDPRIDHYKKELAAYLAEMRGPGPSPMQFKVPSRPMGDATLPVIYEYDIPLEETGGYTANDGKDWAFGTPSNSFGVRGVHDASIDLQGNVWFTYSVPSVTRTYGKIDTKTGEVTNYTVPGRNGMVAGTHGIMRGPDGSMWVNVSGSAGTGDDGEGSPGSLGRIDPSTGKIQIYTPPKGMAGAGGHVDWDGKGFIWAATSKGAIRLDPKTGEFKEFQSVTKNASTYGVAADRDGNGWWAEIGIDKVGHSNVTTGESLEFIVPPNKFVSEGTLTEDDQKLYETSGFGSVATGAPWAQGPRRLAADRNGDVIWVGLYAGSNLLRINTHTLDNKIFPLPSDDLGAYMPVVDNSHSVWVNVQGSDAIEKLDAKTGKWTHYDWPTRGAAPRNISLLDQNGNIQVICAYWGTSAVGRMVVRTKADLQAIKAEAQQVVARNQ